MLIGAVPFEGDVAQGRTGGNVRVIREEAAPPLSRKLTSMGAAATDGRPSSHGPGLAAPTREGT